MSITSYRKQANFAWFVLAFNILVVLWGAFVRATGAGAGCGAHWPMCNGQVVPRAPAVETMIEFAHRLTSGAALLLVLALLIWFWRSYPKGHRARLGAVLSAVFILLEALVGAMLVLNEWVAGDVSIGRVISQGIHLLNTFLLLASLTLAAHWSTPKTDVAPKGPVADKHPGGAQLDSAAPARVERTAAPLRQEMEVSGKKAAVEDAGGRIAAPLRWGLGIGAVLILVLGVSGAITALGDTLFKVSSLAEGIAQDFHPESHFLVRLRVWHPVIAIVTGLYTIFIALLAGLFYPARAEKRLTISLVSLFIVQLGAGLVNLLLLAPVWMQIVHLLLADLVWVAYVLLAVNLLETPAEQIQESAAYNPAANLTETVHEH